MTDIFPQAVIADNFIFISGTTGVNPITGKLSERFEEQAKQCFMNIQTILEEIGSSMDKIVKTTVLWFQETTLAHSIRCMQKLFRRMHRHEVRRR